jgi:hypothetical protein
MTEPLVTSSRVRVLVYQEREPSHGYRERTEVEPRLVLVARPTVVPQHVASVAFVLAIGVACGWGVTLTDGWARVLLGLGLASQVLLGGLLVRRLFFPTRVTLGGGWIRVGLRRQATSKIYAISIVGPSAFPGRDVIAVVDSGGDDPWSDGAVTIVRQVSEADARAVRTMVRRVLGHPDADRP